MKKCLVCRKRPRRLRSLAFCRECAKAYDKAFDSTELSVVEWVAKRAWHFAREASRERIKHLSYAYRPNRFAGKR